MEGFSVLLAFGKWTSPRIQFFPRSVRVVFGPVAFYVSFLDLDMVFVAMTHDLKSDPAKEDPTHGR